CFGDAGVDYLAFVDIDAAIEGGIVENGLIAELGQLQAVGQSSVGQSASGSPGNRARDVGYAVVNNSFPNVGGSRVRGGMNGFYATTLVHTDVDDNRTGLHFADHVGRDDAGGLLAGNEDGADDQIGMGKQGLQVVTDREDGSNLTIEDVVQVAQ